MLQGLLSGLPGGHVLVAALSLALIAGLAACDAGAPGIASDAAVVPGSADERGRQTTPEGLAAMRAQLKGIADARTGAQAKGQNKVSVCHRTGFDANTFILLRVAAPAVNAHLRHGDGLVGGEVPGQPGYTFGDDCSPVEAVVSCPCYDAETIEQAYNFDHGWVTLWDAEYVWQGEEYRTVVLDNDVPSYVWNFWVERIDGVHSCRYGIYSLGEAAYEEGISAAEAEACRLLIYDAGYASCEYPSVYGESNSCGVPFTTDEGRPLAALQR